MTEFFCFKKKKNFINFFFSEQLIFQQKLEFKKIKNFLIKKININKPQSISL